MKSFFKKLAFVMALAMVVSLAAPAAAQAAGSLVLAVKVDGVNVAVTEPVTLALDETVDFNFLGAEPGWQNLVKESEGWKSSNTAVATVNGDGVVTPVAAGTTEITYGLKGYETAKATVTVKADEVVTPDEPEVTEFTYTQTNLKTVVLDYGKDVSGVKKENVNLYRIFISNGKEVEVYWPINTFAVADGLITISSFTKLGDGAVYRVKVDGFEPEDIISVVPEITDIDEITFTYGSDGKNGEAYIYDEETLTPFYIKFKHTLKACGMDVTEMFPQVQVEYVLLSPNPEDQDDAEALQYISFFGDPLNGSLSVMKEMPVTVGVKVTYSGEDGTPVELDGQPQTIVPQKKPEIEFAGITGWTIWDGTGAAKDIKWYDETTAFEDLPKVAAGENGNKVILKLKDTRDNEYVTDAAAVSGKLIYINDTNPYNTSNEYDGIVSLLAGKYWFKYYSTNTDKFLVKESGTSANRYEVPTLTTYTGSEGSVIYVAMYTIDQAGLEQFVDNVYAFRFKIGDAKKHVGFKFDYSNGSTISADAIKLPNDEQGNTVYSPFVKTTVTVTPTHQYSNGVYTGYTGLTEGTMSDNWKVTCNNSKVDNIDAEIIDGVVKVYINGYDLYSKTGAKNFTYTVNVKGVTTTFNISLNTPNWRDFTTEFARTNGETSYSSTVYPAGSDAAGTLVGQYKDILVDVDAYGLKRLNLSTYKPVKLSTHTSGNGKTDFVAEGVVYVNKSSSSIKVGSFNTANQDKNAGDVFTILTDANWATVTGQYHKGQRLVALLDGSGKFVASAGEDKLYDIDAVAGGFSVRFTETDNNGKVTYAKQDNYKLAIYTVTAVNETTGAFSYTTLTSTISVTDDRRQVTAITRVDNDTAKTVADGAKAIFLDAFDVSLTDVANWDLSADLIEDIKVEQNGEYMIIKTVTFKITVDKSAVAGSNYYISVEVPVEMAVKLGYDEP